LSNSVQTVASASQSMYMGSSMFQGQLRVDLIFLCVVLFQQTNSAKNSTDFHLFKVLLLSYHG
jgi:hypothetical protein